MVKTLYVGNIPWSTTESDLEQVFAQYGEVLECRIITERATGRSRGYGFVEVNENDAEQIMEKTNGLEIEGRKLVVNEAKPGSSSNQQATGVAFFAGMIIFKAPQFSVVAGWCIKKKNVLIHECFTMKLILIRRDCAAPGAGLTAIPGVAETALDWGRCGADKRRAYLAGLVHDYAKTFPRTGCGTGGAVWLPMIGLPGRSRACTLQSERLLPLK